MLLSFQHSIDYMYNLSTSFAMTIIQIIVSLNPSNVRLCFGEKKVKKKKKIQTKNINFPLIQTDPVFTLARDRMCRPLLVSLMGFHCPVVL